MSITGLAPQDEFQIEDDHPGDAAPEADEPADMAAESVKGVDRQLQIRREIERRAEQRRVRDELGFDDLVL
jgi:hypothetical protein